MNLSRKTILVFGGAIVISALALFLPKTADRVNADSGTLSVSQSTLFLSSGQSGTVNLYPTLNQVANLTSISNTSAVSATVANNILNIYAINSGTSQIGVCSTNQQCATIFVTVNGNGSNNSNNNGICGTYPYTYNCGSNNGIITLTPSSVNLTAGQNSTVSIFTNNNGNFNSNTYYISSNSNSSVVYATISGNTLNLFSQSNGNSNIIICGSLSGNNGNNGNSNCATLYVTVSGYNNGNNGNNATGLTLAQNSISLNIGQTAYVNVYNNNYGNTFSVNGNSNNNVASASILGNQLSIYGANFGTTTITICSQFSSGCASVFVTVNNTYGNNNGTNNGTCGTYPYIYACGTNGNGNNSALTFVNFNPSQPVYGQYYTTTIQLTGGSTPYNFSLYSGSLPPGLTLSNNGIISGTPSQIGTFNFIVRANDYYSNSVVSSTIALTVSGFNNGNNSNCYLNLGYYVCNSNQNNGQNNGQNGTQVLGASSYISGTLIKENGTIYVTYKNSKSGFANQSAFNGLGYKLENVLYITNSGLIDSGHVVSSAFTAHPWGSWIKNNGTIYFVHDSGLIPITSYDVFLNNGGQNANVVAANIYDFNKPALQPMVFNDSRLR